MPSSVWRADEVYEVSIRDVIRDWVLVQGRSQRSAAQQFDVSRDTVARLLAEPADGRERRYQRQQPRPAPKRAAALPHIERWLAENARLQRVAPKQRWTARRMWGELRQLGIEIVGRGHVRSRHAQRDYLQTDGEMEYQPSDDGGLAFDEVAPSLLTQEAHSAPMLPAAGEDGPRIKVKAARRDRGDLTLLSAAPVPKLMVQRTLSLIRERPLHWFIEREGWLAASRTYQHRAQTTVVGRQLERAHTGRPAWWSARP